MNIRPLLRLLLIVASLAECVSASAQQLVIVPELVKVEVPESWRLVNERELVAVGARVTTEAAKAGLTVNLKDASRIIYAPVSKHANANVVISVRPAAGLPFGNKGIVAGGLLPQVVVSSLAEPQRVFEQFLAGNGGRLISRLEPRAISIKGAVGIEQGNTYDQAAGRTTNRQVLVIHRDHLISVTFAYFQASEQEFAPLYQNLLSSIQIL